LDFFVCGGVAILQGVFEKSGVCLMVFCGEVVVFCWCNVVFCMVISGV